MVERVLNEEGCACDGATDCEYKVEYLIVPEYATSIKLCSLCAIRVYEELRSVLTRVE